MIATVISHRRASSKRSRMRTLAGALAVASAAILVASLLGPYLFPAPVPDFPEQLRPVLAARKAPEPIKVAAKAETATGLEPAPSAPAPRRVRRGVPLNAQTPPAAEDYEVLTAAELDAISQAD